MSNQIVISSGAKVRNLNGVLTGTSGVVDALGINVPDGVPQLDGSGKILVSQLPNSVMEFKGTWSAATNTPTLVNGTGNAGDVYLCNAAGTVNFGAGPITFANGDQVIYTGTIWDRASGATGTVSSVAVTESGDALTITGSPITTSGTINIGFAGTSGQYVNGAGGLTTFPSLTGFVPYTGATSDVDLGTYGLIGDYARFNTTPSSVPTTLGTLSWDSTYRTLQLIDGDGDTTLQIGQEQRALIHNNTGATLTDGQVVYVTGSTGNLPSVALASNATEASSSVTFGVVTETIANGADGFVTISGNVNGLNTLAFNEGDALYLGATAGTFTNVKPTAPANLVLIGYMIKKSGGNGIIFVKIQNGYELEELHDVSITSVANNDGLFWDSATSLWKNKTIANVLGYTPADDSLVVKLAGTQTITGLKTFGVGLQFPSAGSGNQSSYFVNTSSIHSGSAGSNGFGFNNSNNIYFGKGSSNGGVLAWNNTAIRSYNLPDTSGTIALTSDLSGYLPLTGGTLTGTLNGTNAIFSSTVQASAIKLTGMTAGSGALYWSSDRVTLANYNASGVVHIEANGGTGVATFGGATYNNDFVGTGRFTGALSGTSATFSSSVTANNFQSQSNIGVTSIGSDSVGGGAFTALVNGSNSYQVIQQLNASYGLDWWTYNGTFNKRMTLTQSGNVGIGTSSPDTKLQVAGTGSTGASIRTDTSGDAYYRLYLDSTIYGHWYADRANSKVTFGAVANVPLSFDTNGTERMRITSGGTGLFATTTASAGSFATASFQVGNEVVSKGALAGFFWESRSGGVTANSNWYGWYAQSATIYLYNGAANCATINPSTGIYTPLSDINKKKDFEESTIGLNAILGLKPTLYRMKTDNESVEKQLGFIAQEVKEFIPQAYVESGEGEDKFIGLQDRPIIAALVKAIQELSSELTELKALIAAK